MCIYKVVGKKVWNEDYLRAAHYEKQFNVPALHNGL